MRKRKKVVLFATSLLVAVALVALLTRDTGPRYKGNSLTYWVLHMDVYGAPTPDRPQAAQAIRMIGTNAIPYLIKWIQQEDKPWQARARWRLSRSIWNHAVITFFIGGQQVERADGALVAFGILGTNAASAIPELTTMMNDKTRPLTSQRAIAALTSLGAPAFPHITAALSNTNQAYRACIPYFLTVNMAHDLGTNACLPPLIAALKDPDLQVRYAATQALAQLTNVPAR